ncbi:hypothetical protein AZE42_04190 [Rhizopogon vesiculosus]|uniref:Uncharacterized protein n=1 Tax=Rhizopogon vesiculosus TaxID=180088 RepID=A0A1J8PZU1_9AGAM|nr:hypothetical protein AZE42_04190 [Rhizopogon vesiculosus]
MFSLQSPPTYITNETTSTRLMEEVEEHLPLLDCSVRTIIILFLINRVVQAGRSGNYIHKDRTPYYTPVLRTPSNLTSKSDRDGSKKRLQPLRSYVQPTTL